MINCIVPQTSYGSAGRSCRRKCNGHGYIFTAKTRLALRGGEQSDYNEENAYVGASGLTRTLIFNRAYKTTVVKLIRHSQPVLRTRPKGLHRALDRCYEVCPPEPME